MNDRIRKAACLVSPSLICLDMCNLESQVRALEEFGIGMLHIDILDGHFSPSLPLGLETVRQLRKKTDLCFDAHLMATCNDYFIDELLDIGVQQIVFHGETEPHVDNQLNRIKARGVRAGVALKPGTPLNTLDCILEKCDTVLLMLINPGYAWNKAEQQVAYGRRKILELRELIATRNLDTLIAIDGRVSIANIREYGHDLVDLFVVGSTCINYNDIINSVKMLNTVRQDVLGHVEQP
jgi:ribulose-phosphate 3-epimerase